MSDPAAKYVARLHQPPGNVQGVLVRAHTTRNAKSKGNRLVSRAITSLGSLLIASSAHALLVFHVRSTPTLSVIMVLSVLKYA